MFVASDPPRSCTSQMRDTTDISCLCSQRPLADTCRLISVRLAGKKLITKKKNSFVPPDYSRSYNPHCKQRRRRTVEAATPRTTLISQHALQTVNHTTGASKVKAERNKNDLISSGITLEGSLHHAPHV